MLVQYDVWHHRIRKLPFLSTYTKAINRHFRNLHSGERFLERCVFGDRFQGILVYEAIVRNNDVTSQHGGLEISSSGFELAWISVVFRIFPAIYARRFVTLNAWRLEHKVMNNGFEMLEKARFFFWCTCQFSGNFTCHSHLHFGISLVKNFFRS